MRRITSSVGLADLRAGLGADLLAEGGEHRLGARLHGLHHRQDEALLGSEVVQEHAVARAGGLGDAPQALVGQAVGGEVGDDRVEQALPGVGSGGLGFHMYQMVHSPRPEKRNRMKTDGDETAMAQQVIDRTMTTSGDPAAVYALLADGSTWPGWSPIGSFELLAPGDGSPEGLGAGTTINWRSTFRAKVPGSGGIYRRQLGAFISQTVEGLAGGSRPGPAARGS